MEGLPFWLPHCALSWMLQLLAPCHIPYRYRVIFCPWGEKRWNSIWEDRSTAYRTWLQKSGDRRAEDVVRGHHDAAGLLKAEDIESAKNPEGERVLVGITMAAHWAMADRLHLVVDDQVHVPYVAGKDRVLAHAIHRFGAGRAERLESYIGFTPTSLISAAFRSDKAGVRLRRKDGQVPNGRLVEDILHFRPNSNSLRRCSQSYRLSSIAAKMEESVLSMNLLPFSP